MSRVLVIDDDELLRRFVVALLERWNYVQSTDNGEAGIKLAGETVFDLIITDLGLPGISGLETIKQIRRDKPDIKILAVSGSRSGKGDHLDDPGRLGADAVLGKPFEPGISSISSPGSSSRPFRLTGGLLQSLFLTHLQKGGRFAQCPRRSGYRAYKADPAGRYSS